MSVFLFAHNGIDHANHVEAAAHESNTIVWVLLAFALVSAALFAAKKLFGKRDSEEADEDEA